MSGRAALSLLLAALLFCSAAGGAKAPAGADAARPRLVVLVIVDQLRGDMPWRFRERFGEGGFRYLMDHGVSYRNAHFRHAATSTAVGHASLVTGGNVPQHGLPGNNWRDPQTARRVYCVEDDRHAILGEKPPRKSRTHQGASPRNLLASTFGDELILARAGRPRVFSVSLKDRAAILSAGRLGKAFWYAKRSGRFVTSSYYYDAGDSGDSGDSGNTGGAGTLPAWVQEWNAAGHADRYRGQQWTLLGEAAGYLHAGQDDRLHERPYGRLGRTFPHPLGGGPLFHATLRFTPMGDSLTLDFARELTAREQLGQGKDTDVLIISFSATDYIGHAFGPNSLEAEDNLLRLDRTLADFFAFIDGRVGLDNTLIALASDHGVAAIPEHQQSLGRKAGRHNIDKIMAAVNEALKERFHQDNLVAAFWNPSFYLDLEAAAEAALPLSEVEDALAEALRGIPGIALAVTRSDLLLRQDIASPGGAPREPLLDKLQNAFHPERSGNVLVIPKPSWHLSSGLAAAMHGSPYHYDTHVPLAFAGPGIGRGEVTRAVAPEDLAPTLSRYLGAPAPSGATGAPLPEILQHAPGARPEPRDHDRVGASDAAATRD